MAWPLNHSNSNLRTTNRYCTAVRLTLARAPVAIAALLLVIHLDSSSVRAQSGSTSMISPGPSPVSIPQTNLAPIAPGGAGGGGFGSAPSFGAGSNLGTIAPSLSAPSLGTSSLGPPSSTSGGSLFDPYATGATPGYYQPALPPGSVAPTTPPTVPGALGAPGGFFGGLFSRPASAPLSPGLNAPVLNAPIPGATPQATPPPYYGSPVAVPNTYGVPPGYGAPAFPSSIYPSGTPSTLFPGGLYGGGFGAGVASGFNAYRFLQGPRLRHAYIGSGNGVSDLSINDTDVSVAFAFQNFLYSSQPLYVVPSFSLHLWDGPQSSSGADLPSNAYSGFLDFGWQTEPNRMFGVELGVRVGAFTAFDTFRDDSIRVLGKGLASFRLTPASTLKVGVYYLDRLDWKLIPAGGVLWQPNPQTRFDIFFPQPKFARYCRTIGTHDVWWYLSGDYGGGSWTIERAGTGASDQVDINDLRVMTGWEWGRSDLIRTGRRTAFAEIGYVFERELIYRSGVRVDPDDAIMVRAGFGY